MRKEFLKSIKPNHRRKTRSEENPNISSMHLSTSESSSQVVDEIDHVSFYLLFLM